MVNGGALRDTLDNSIQRYTGSGVSGAEMYIGEFLVEKHIRPTELVYDS